MKNTYENEMTLFIILSLDQFLYIVSESTTSDWSVDW